MASSIPLSYYTIAGVAAGTGFNAGNLAFRFLLATEENKHPGSAVLDAIADLTVTTETLGQRTDLLESALVSGINLLASRSKCKPADVLRNLADLADENPVHEVVRIFLEEHPDAYVD